MVRPGDAPGSRTLVMFLHGRREACHPAPRPDAKDWTRTPHWPSEAFGAGQPSGPAWELAWGAAGARSRLSLAAAWDLSAATDLNLRTVVDPVRGAVTLGVRLSDGTRTATLPIAAGGVLPALPGRSAPLGKLWAQTLRVPLNGADVDLTRIRAIDLVGQSADGRVWVLDLGARRAGLPTVPSRRLPTLDLHSVSIVEGHGPDRRRRPDAEGDDRRAPPGRPGGPACPLGGHARPAGGVRHLGLRASVRGPGAAERLAVADMPKGWRVRHVDRPKPACRPLAAAGTTVLTTLAAGRRTAVLSIPTRGDAARESTESVTLTITLDSSTKVATRTVRVLDSR